MKKDDEELRIIKTARTPDEMNKAVEEGYWPLVLELEPLGELTYRFRVYQNIKTGRVLAMGDMRMVAQYDANPDYKLILGWRTHYAHKRKYHFAAYLLPPDLKVNERVYLEDVIEDIVEGISGQGHSYRLNSAEAIWNGKKFEIQFDPSKDVQHYIG